MLCTCVQGGKKTRCRKNTMLESIAGSAGTMREPGESVSIENQKIMLSRYVQEQGWNLYAAYCDDGVSGTTFVEVR